MNNVRCTLGLLLMSLGSTGFSQSTDAQEIPNVEKDGDKAAPVKLVEVALANGAVELQVPETWKQKQPRSRIVEREFAIPAAKGDEQDGRLTMMRSGGSVTQNIERWFSQFSQPDKKPTKDVAKVAKKKINDQEVVIVDIAGTFQDRQGGGPFAPGKVIQREGYRMLGGIVQTKQRGQYFFKLYGPKKTIATAAEAFAKMMESVTSE